MVRLVIVTVAVAIGSALLLTAIAGTNACISQNQRYAWLETGTLAVARGPGDGGHVADPLWWHPSGDHYDGQTIGRVDVAATGAIVAGPAWHPAVPGARRSTTPRPR